MKQNETPGIEGKRQASILLLLLLFLMHHKSGMQTLGGGILCAGTTCPQRMIDHEGKSRLADEQGRCAAPLLPTGELGDSGTSGPPRHSRRWRQGSSPLIVQRKTAQCDKMQCTTNPLQLAPGAGIMGASTDSVKSVALCLRVFRASLSALVRTWTWGEGKSTALAESSKGELRPSCTALYWGKEDGVDGLLLPLGSMVP